MASYYAPMSLFEKLELRNKLSWVGSGGGSSILLSGWSSGHLSGWSSGHIFGGWLDQVGIRLTQLSTGLKVEAELGNNFYGV